MLLTRRSLLRVGALAPLVLPRPAIARVLMGRGGASVGGPGPPDPCGTPTPLAGGFNVAVSTPGCYSLTGDVTNELDVHGNDVTVLGNGHTVASLRVGNYPTYDGSGVVVKNLVVGGIFGYGNLAITQTALAFHLDNVSTPPGTAAISPVNLHGSNYLVENCTFNGSYPGTDDCAIAVNANSSNPTVYYITFNNCHFTDNYDVGLEGEGNWDHATITNCVSNNPSGSVGSIGGWFGVGGAGGAYDFQLTNCTFTGNTVRGGFRFTTPGNNIFNAVSDAIANGTWGTGGSAGMVGNVFGGAGPLANTYI